MRLLLSFCLVISSLFAVPEYAKADAFDDLNFLNNYNSSSCSGQWTGMTCRDGGKRRETPFERAERKRIEEEKVRSNALAAATLTALERVIAKSNSIKSRWGRLPQSSKFSNEQVYNLMCLRAHIGALVFLQEEPLAFMALSAERGPGDPVHYGSRIARDHSYYMYLHASKLLLNSYSFKPSNLSEIEAFIKSQLVPSLEQVTYLTETVPLQATDLKEPLFQVAYRIGFFSDSFVKPKYIFTRSSCQDDPEMTPSASVYEALKLIFYDKDYMVQRKNLMKFQVERVLPSSLGLSAADSAEDLKRHSDALVAVYEQQIATEMKLFKGATPACYDTENDRCPSDEQFRTMAKNFLARKGINDPRQTPTQVWIGISTRDVISVEGGIPGWNHKVGAVVEQVVKGSPADIAGVRLGDVIYHFGEVYVNNSKELLSAVTSLEVNVKTNMSIFRNGESIAVSVRAELRR